MGDGKVLESGNHDELLRREGNYHRLVQAQKLRESVTTDGESESSDTKQDIALQEDLPLTRKNTDHSLASEIIEQKRKESGPEHVKDIGLFALARRLLPLIRDKHKSYLIGAFFACCECVCSHSLPSSHSLLQVPVPSTPLSASCMRRAWRASPSRIVTQCVKLETAQHSGTFHPFFPTP